jgi:hypothetical protein
MQFIIFVDVDRQLLRLLSPLPFDMVEDKRIDGAIATCHATYGLRDGSFDYDLSNGRISFRMTSAFLDNDIPVSVLQYMWWGGTCCLSSPTRKYCWDTVLRNFRKGLL